MKVLLIIGLPGSGKSYLCEKLESEYVIFDDNIDLEEVKRALGSNKDICISDCNLCLDSVRGKAIEFCKNYTNNIELIYFENNPQKCISNVRLRNDGRKVDSYIAFLSKRYNSPEEAREIWMKEIVTND